MFRLRSKISSLAAVKTASPSEVCDLWSHDLKAESAKHLTSLFAKQNTSLIFIRKSTSLWRSHNFNKSLCLKASYDIMQKKIDLINNEKLVFKLNNVGVGIPDDPLIVHIYYRASRMKSPTKPILHTKQQNTAKEFIFFCRVILFKQILFTEYPYFYCHYNNRYYKYRRVTHKPLELGHIGKVHSVPAGYKG